MNIHSITVSVGIWAVTRVIGTPTTLYTLDRALYQLSYQGSTASWAQISHLIVHLTCTQYYNTIHYINYFPTRSMVWSENSRRQTDRQTNRQQTHRKTTVTLIVHLTCTQYYNTIHYIYYSLHGRWFGPRIVVDKQTDRQTDNRHTERLL